jgi:hypothetical protein
MMFVQRTSTRHMRHAVVLHHAHRRIGPHSRLLARAIRRLVRIRTKLRIVHHVLRLLAGHLSVCVVGALWWRRGAIGIEGCRRRRVCRPRARAVAIGRSIHSREAHCDRAAGILVSSGCYRVG